MAYIKLGTKASNLKPVQATLKLEERNRALITAVKETKGIQRKECYGNHPYSSRTVLYNHPLPG